MPEDRLRRKSGKGRPEIWASGGQRPPFDLRAFGRASLHLARSGVAPVHAWAARATRGAAVRVKGGAGRIPAGKLGRMERFVPSHLRVAGWIKTLAAVLSHASATADPDIRRGNALVAEIAPHLWEKGLPAPEPAETAPLAGEVGPVVLREPPPVLLPGDDPLASIRAELAPDAEPRADRQDIPPTPPGPVAEGAIQVSGYLLGWASTILALPYGLARALWLFAAGRDLRGIGQED